MNSRRSALLIAAGIASGIAPLLALAQSDARIPLTQLETMFSNMRAKTKWNLDAPLLWGFFFLDPNRAKLSKLANQLESEGYMLAGIEPILGSIMNRLHMEKIETHSPASLHARNTGLYELAAKYGVASYDGMDVGPAPAAPK